MPYKNTSQYIGDCILSIINQSYKNWELIAVNDNSSDESETIIHRFAQNDKRIKTINNSSSGIINALNTGYAQASGAYITRMDSDDLMPQEKLETLYNLIKNKGKGFVATGHVKYFSDKTVGSGYTAYQKWLNSLCNNNAHWEEIFKECVIASPNWLILKTDFDNCGAFNSERYPEDYDLCFRWYKQGLTIIGTKEITHLWREHGQRTSRNSDNYEDFAFTKMKVDYFLKQEKPTTNNIILWGAGNKAKDIASILKNSSFTIHWISVNPEKIGKTINGIVIQPFSENLPEGIHIISIVDEKAKSFIKQWMNKRKRVSNYDYFFFG